MKEVTHLMQHLYLDIYSMKNPQGYLLQGIAFYFIHQSLPFFQATVSQNLTGSLLSGFLKTMLSKITLVTNPLCV